MSDKKELYEVLLEEITHKMDLVLEGYSEMGRNLEEARTEREQIRADLTFRIDLLAKDLKETRAELRSKIAETKTELKSEIKETRKELCQKIDTVTDTIADHEIRIEKLEDQRVTY